MRQRLLFLFTVFSILSLGEMLAQGIVNDSIIMPIHDTSIVNDQSIKEYLRECKLQVDYYLNQKNTEAYLFVIDGEVLNAKKFKEYKKSILEQSESIQFIDSLDSLLGYSSKNQHLMILINTKNTKNLRHSVLGF